MRAKAFAVNQQIRDDNRLVRHDTLQRPEAQSQSTGRSVNIVSSLLEGELSVINPQSNPALGGTVYNLFPT